VKGFWPVVGGPLAGDLPAWAKQLSTPSGMSHILADV
jgi:hypothetical protein